MNFLWLAKCRWCRWAHHRTLPRSCWVGLRTHRMWEEKRNRSIGLINTLCSSGPNHSEPEARHHLHVRSAHTQVVCVWERWQPRVTSDLSWSVHVCVCVDGSLPHSLTINIHCHVLWLMWFYNKESDHILGEVLLVNESQSITGNPSPSGDSISLVYWHPPPLHPCMKQLMLRPSHCFSNRLYSLAVYTHSTYIMY